MFEGSKLLVCLRDNGISGVRGRHKSFITSVLVVIVLSFLLASFDKMVSTDLVTGMAGSFKSYRESQTAAPS